MKPTFIPPVATLHPRTKQLADATKYTVSTAVALTLLHNRDAKTILYATGALLSSISAKLLKLLIKQPRPTHTKSDPGMPSSHATSLSFLSIAAWGGRSGIRGMFAFLGILAALIGSFARVRVGYHSLPQVVAGWILGFLNAVLWLFIHDRFVSPLQAVMDNFGDTFVMVALAFAASIIALPAILEHLRKE